ncbi:ATP-grasp domain-containing protein [Kitasatospora camelliae]|uniref:Alpha-L-glutamate ligase n=1 Tax=Kitasatospora camelliae TaxID=3156397 RepID=A0AAU8K518_9ACTN
MRIGLITANPDHPLLADTARLLRAAGHLVTRTTGEDEAVDVQLLKARTPEAVALARRYEAAGVPVLNSADSTGFCQDRLAMARLAEAAGLPFARTVESAAGADEPSFAAGPLVVKSRHSRRGDLVARVDGPAQVRVLAERWPGEDLVLQELAPNSGWDHKIWVVAGRVFAELRRSELAEGTGRRQLDTLPDGYRELALRTGEVFGLDVYGVDVLDVAGSPLIVDVNAFPGIRGQQGAPAALADLALAAADGRHLPRTAPVAA